MSNCSRCLHRGYDALSDFCDGCTHDSDTGWGGFYDHRVDRHFNSTGEQQKYYEREGDDAGYDTPRGWPWW